MKFNSSDDAIEIVNEREVFFSCTEERGREKAEFKGRKKAEYKEREREKRLGSLV